MDGTSVDFIVIPIVAVISIPIVAVISLAAWLVMVYWADSHPRKSQQTVTMTDEHDAVAGPAGTVHPVAGQVNVPGQPAAPTEHEDVTPARQLSGSR